MNTENNGWVAFKDGEPVYGKTTLLGRYTEKGDFWPAWHGEWRGTVYIPKNTWTHWHQYDLPPPPKPKTQRELDEEAFKEWHNTVEVWSERLAWHDSKDHERAEIRKLVEEMDETDTLQREGMRCVAVQMSEEVWTALKQRLGVGQ